MFLKRKEVWEGLSNLGFFPPLLESYYRGRCQLGRLAIAMKYQPEAITFAFLSFPYHWHQSENWQWMAVVGLWGDNLLEMHNWMALSLLFKMEPLVFILNIMREEAVFTRNKTDCNFKLLEVIMRCPFDS